MTPPARRASASRQRAYADRNGRPRSAQASAEPAHASAVAVHVPGRVEPGQLGLHPQVEGRVVGLAAGAGVATHGLEGSQQTPSLGLPERAGPVVAMHGGGVGQRPQPEGHQRRRERLVVGARHELETVQHDVVRRLRPARPELDLRCGLQDLPEPGDRRALDLDHQARLLAALPGRGQVAARHRDAGGRAEHGGGLDAPRVAGQRLVDELARLGVPARLHQLLAHVVQQQAALLSFLSDPGQLADADPGQLHGIAEQAGHAEEVAEVDVGRSQVLRVLALPGDGERLPEQGDAAGRAGRGARRRSPGR